MAASTYLDLEGLSTYDYEIKEYIKKLVAESVVDMFFKETTYLKFPTVGKENCIYIDTTSNVIYRWDATDLHYYVIGFDYQDVAVISGDRT